MNRQVEDLIEKWAGKLFLGVDNPSTDLSNYYDSFPETIQRMRDIVKELLKDPSIAIIDEDQSLPIGDYPYKVGDICADCEAYEIGQKDMLNSGFKKVILPSEILKEEVEE